MRALHIHSLADLREAARAVLDALGDHTVVAFRGPMGALGKTTCSSARSSHASDRATP